MYWGCNLHCSCLNRSLCPCAVCEGGILPRSPTPLSLLLTSRRGRLQHHPDELGHVKVGGVVQGSHVCPAGAQARLGTQGEQLTGEAGRCICIT